MQSPDWSNGENKENSPPGSQGGKAEEENAASGSKEKASSTDPGNADPWQGPNDPWSKAAASVKPRVPPPPSSVEATPARVRCSECKSVVTASEAATCEKDGCQVKVCVRCAEKHRGSCGEQEGRAKKEPAPETPAAAETTPGRKAGEPKPGGMMPVSGVGCIHCEERQGVKFEQGEWSCRACGLPWPVIPARSVCVGKTPISIDALVPTGERIKAGGVGGLLTPTSQPGVPPGPTQAPSPGSWMRPAGDDFAPSTEWKELPAGITIDGGWDCMWTKGKMWVRLPTAPNTPGEGVNTPKQEVGKGSPAQGLQTPIQQQPQLQAPWPGMMMMMVSPNGCMVPVMGAGGQMPPSLGNLGSGVPILPTVTSPGGSPGGVPGAPPPSPKTLSSKGSENGKEEEVGKAALATVVETPPKPGNTFQVWSSPKEEQKSPTPDIMYYTMVQTPQGPMMTPVALPEGAGGSWSGSNRTQRPHDNSRVQLPWYLFWDGTRRSDGTAMGLLEWEKRLRGWKSEFTSDIGLGAKALNGITDSDLWDDAEAEDPEPLAAEGGIELLIDRVRSSLLSKGVHLQEEKSLEYWGAEKRPYGQQMRKFLRNMQNKRKHLAESLGLKKGEESQAVNDRLHGLQILAKCRISKLEQRQIQRDVLKKVPAGDEAARLEAILKDLTATYWDIHKDEKVRRTGTRPRRGGRHSYVARREAGKSEESGSDKESGSSRSTASEEDTQSSASSRDHREGFVAAGEQEEEADEGSQSDSSQGTISLKSGEVDVLDYKSFQAYAGYKSAKEMVREYQKKRGFDEAEPKKHSHGSSSRSQNARGRGRKDRSRNRSGGRRGRSPSRRPLRSGSRGGKRSTSRKRSSSRPGERGRCAICGKEGHWKNECDLRGTEADKGPRPPSRPSSRPPSSPAQRGAPRGERKKRGGQPRKSFFSALVPALLPSVMLTCFCYLGETLKLSPGDKDFRGTSWGNKLHRRQPEFFQRWVKEWKPRDWKSKGGLENFRENLLKPPPGPDLANHPQSWSALKAEVSSGSGVMDSACNMSMVGELTLNRQAKHLLKRWGLRIHRYPVKNGDSFKFGDAETVRVEEHAVRPIGILGRSGELLLRVIPGADTPLLVAKDDLGALGLLLGFAFHKAILLNLSNEVLDLKQTASGHYELPLDQFPEGGHETPYDTWSEGVTGDICGPSLTIYKAHKEKELISEERSTKSHGRTDIFKKACERIQKDAYAVNREKESEKGDDPPPLVSDSSDDGEAKRKPRPRSRSVSSSSSCTSSSSEELGEPVAQLKGNCEDEEDEESPLLKESGNSSLGNRMKYKPEEVTVINDECKAVLSSELPSKSWEGQQEELPPLEEGWEELEDDWKKAPRAAGLPKRWKGITWFETKERRWVPVFHKQWREQACGPSHLGRQSEWTGRRVTRFFV